MNYYEIVGVAPTASNAEIEQKIKEEYRKNQRRVNHADQAKRQAAERRAEQLMEAKRVLLDPDQRSAHDTRLASTPVSTREPIPLTNDWLAEAERRGDAGDYHGALYCAKEARHVLGDGVAEVWNLMAKANGSLGNLQDALFEARRAVSLEPDNPEHHFVLGAVHEELQQWDAAISEFEAVRRLEPSAEHASVAIAYVLLQSGRGPAGLQLLEQLYATTSNREFVGDALGFALVSAANAVPAYRDERGYFITSRAEITQMRQYLARAYQVSTDPELPAEINQMESYLRWSESKHVPPGSWIRSSRMAKTSFVVTVLVLLSCFGGPKIDQQSHWRQSLLLALGYGGLLVVVFVLSLRTRWKTSRKVWRYEQRQRG